MSTRAHDPGYAYVVQFITYDKGNDKFYLDFKCPFCKSCNRHIVDRDDYNDTKCNMFGMRMCGYCRDIYELRR